MNHLQSLTAGRSQHDLFGEIPVVSKAVRPKLAPVKSHKSVPVFSGGLFALNDTVSPERFSAVFHSGGSAYFDALGLTTAGKDVGVVADLIRPRVMHLLKDYLSRGGKCFVDSGASYGRFAKWKERNHSLTLGEIMQAKYSVADIEAYGVQASGTFHGTPRKGWIMDREKFVDYAGYVQLVIPVTEATDLVIGDWSSQTTEAKRLHAVIDFQRDVQFPRFSMKKGEKWGFVVYKKWHDALKAIEAGDRFAFAGGQCLAQDVVIVYIGPSNIEYSRAAGYLK